MRNPMVFFEHLRKQIEETTPPPSADQRKRIVFGRNDGLSVARDINGRFEVFLAVDNLSVTSSLIDKQIMKDVWRTDNGHLFTAYRVLIPGEPHFIGVVALIVEELLRHGFESDPQLAFSRSEPLIELALERARVGDDAALGLLGELIFLEQILVQCPQPELRGRVIESWTGYRNGSRDFTGVCATIEVKTTTQNRSRHHISNLDQVTKGPIGSSFSNQKLFLVSIGLTPAEGNGKSLASQVEIVSQLLTRELSTAAAEKIRGEFLHCIKIYGIGNNQTGGYDHLSMQTWVVFARKWEICFLRTYDMEDELIKVLRRPDLTVFSHVSEETVRYEFELPEMLRGNINPTTDPSESIRLLLNLVEYN